jgi:hypothetical protein
VIVVALAAACATGGEGSMLTSFASGPSTAGQDASTASPDTSTTTGDGSGDSGQTGTTGVDTGASGNGPDTSVGSSGDTGSALPCDAALETFGTNPAWATMGLPDGGTVFGWGTTAFAAGDAGEIGGTLQRSGSGQYYADTTIAVASGECIAAQGRLIAPMEDADFNSIVSFGHFSTGGGPHIGFSFGEGDASTLRVFLVAGSVSQQVFLMEDIATPRTWSYEYDPGSGMMTLEMEGLGSQSVPVAPADVGGIEAIDAFGMFKTPHETPELYTGLLEVYLDEITYTR